MYTYKMKSSLQFKLGLLIYIYLIDKCVYAVILIYLFCDQ